MMNAIRTISWMVVALGLLQAAPAGAQSKDEQEVLNLSRQKFGWLIRGQADSLAWLLDARVEYTHSNGWVQTREEVLNDMKSRKLVYQQVVIKSAAARAYGNTVVVTGLGTFAGVNSGTAFTLDLRYTEVYVREDGRWKLVSRHSNRMP